LHYFLAFIETGKEKKKKNTAAGPKLTQGHNLLGERNGGIGQRLEGGSSPSSFDGGEADRAAVRDGDGKVR
jgi:hypothetical protein